MFGHNPQSAPAAAIDENAKLKRQLDEVLARTPTTELEKMLLSENLALKAEVERLTKLIEAERSAVSQRILCAQQSAMNHISSLSSLYR